MAEWTEETKAQLIEQYEAAEPTPETTTDIVAELAEEFGATVNGVRIILSKAGVYVSKAKVKATTSGSKATRKSKQDSLNELSGILTELGVEIDSTIVDKLTGKAAEYFIGAFKQAIDNTGE